MFYKILEYNDFGKKEEEIGIFNSKKTALKKIKNKRSFKLAFFVEKTDNFKKTSVIQNFFKKTGKPLKTEWFY